MLKTVADPVIDTTPSLGRRSLLRLAIGATVGLAWSALTGCVAGPIPPPGVTVLDVVPRASWGAAEPDIAGSTEGVYDVVANPSGVMVYPEPLPDALNTIVVHHTALPLSDGPLEIQQKHMNARGYADIGYHYVIDDTGTVYEGRNLYYRGAHTGGYNTGTIGVVLTGNFQHMQPSQAQIDSLQLLIRALARQYTITHMAGHRDFQPGDTVCPGDNLAVLLPDVAAATGVTFGTGGYAGP